MYPNYSEDRKALWYEALIDTTCGKSLALITGSTVFVRLNRKREIIVIIGVIIFTFSVAESAEAMGTNPLPPQMVTNITDQDVSKWFKLSINLDIEPKPSSVRIRAKSDLCNSQWLKEFLSTVRGGDNEKLIKSIISKVSETDWDIPSINKILKKLAEVTFEIGTNDKLLRILAELEKPIPQPSIVVEAWSNPLPRRRKEVEKKTYSSPSIESLLDSTKCYAHREAFNMPRSVGESFQTKAVKKLSKISLKNTKLQKEYESVKNQLREGVHPVNLSERSTYVSSTKVLVKKPEGRYLIEVSDTSAEIVGVSSRSNQKCMAKFERLMNELYNLNIKGY